MTKIEFMTLMRFPAEWDVSRMYPDELFAIQLAHYEPGHEQGSEHHRNGAFHWWLKQGPTADQLQALRRLAQLDPDSLMGQDVLRYIDQAIALKSACPRTGSD
jgi:hypothetical protein